MKIRKQDRHKNITNIQDDNEPSTWQVYFATCILFSSVLCLVIVVRSWPKQDGVEDVNVFWTNLKIPTTAGDAKEIGSLILRYKDDHAYLVFGAYFATYILLQSFCIPGSLVLSILAGYIFPAPLALLIICVCSTLGASTFYIMVYKRKQQLFRLLGSSINSRIDKFNNFVQPKIEKYRSNLFLCVFILRATPIFPNWTINLCSPLINLPFRPFVLGTFTGVLPLSVIHVWTGRILNDLSNDESLINWQSILMTSLLAISIVLLLYVRRIT